MHLRMRRYFEWSDGVWGSVFHELILLQKGRDEKEKIEEKKKNKKLKMSGEKWRNEREKKKWKWKFIKRRCTQELFGKLVGWCVRPCWVVSIYGDAISGYATFIAYHKHFRIHSARYKDFCSLIRKAPRFQTTFATLFFHLKLSVFSIRSNQRRFISHPYYIYLMYDTSTVFFSAP